MPDFGAINIYNHYLTTYAPKGTTPFDTHKKSELRNIYNSMVKLNKESPLFLLHNTRATQQFAVGIKENARELRNTIASLGGLDEQTMLNQKIACSSNENIAAAKFIGEQSPEQAVPFIDLEVLSLASPQTNMGNYLEPDALELAPGSYSFDIGINDLNYEFQYNINDDDTNKTIQQRLARLINNSGIGLESELLEDSEGNTALVLRSQTSGLPNGKERLFTVTDDRTSKASGTVSYFGIDEITRNATNAEFILNGVEKTAYSNNFTIEKTYEITLNGVSSSEGETARIGLKTDVESLTENINSLLGGYNNFLKAASEYNQEHTKGHRLLQEMKSISSYYKNNFDSVGLTVQDDGTVTIDKDMLNQMAESGDLEDLSSTMKNFTASLLRKSTQISLNPMDYVDKIIVAYKNPGKNFVNPYMTSPYSGMMFNSYC